MCIFTVVLFACGSERFSMDPPQVQPSPQQQSLNPPTSANPIVGATTTAQLTLDMVHAASVNRERLSEWHHKIRSKMFPLAAGFFVRCRVEDSTEGRALYKVGRIKILKPDWSVELDLITTDELRAGKANTNYDCISNSKLSETEFNTWIGKLPPENVPAIIAQCNAIMERQRLMDTLILTELAAAKKSKEEKAKDSAQSTAAPETEKFTFSTNVLLVGEGECYLPQTMTIVDLLTNAVGLKGVSEPDTPRAAGGGGGAKPKSFDEALASNSTMVSLADVQGYAQSPVAPPADPARLVEVIRKAANPGFTQFSYDNLPELCKLIVSVCGMCREIVAKEKLFLHLKSPIVVFGDIHGNFADMHFFLEKVIAFDDIMLKYTTTNLLFLGDYVDRGTFSLECVMYLMALKCMNPGKIHMLRGNHESPEVNGDMDVYGYSSFKYQCLDKFGREKGMDVWIAVNEVFQYLPVIADIDKKIFCVHGGLPQYSGGEDNRLEVLADPNFPRVPVVQCNDPSNVAQRMIVNDLLWSDPAGPGHPVDKYGFGPNPRGPDIKTFGARAVDMFCERYGYQFIFRAHQEKADGVRVSDNARVVTIFSTSDYAGHQNGAGCVLVHGGKIRMAIKKPANKEQPQAKGNVSPRTLGRGLPNFVPRKR